ncbi:hypothetical protein F2Q70_00028349 [Brassica cretica]|uniref:Uncharacterized protein n=1 Tax=Brassica cretica TaxID=69181 RepID=A0A8S9LHR7_BRACR|nr:hypothetical protein F2Q70_00028349 [Brassica cretica]
MKKSRASWRLRASHDEEQAEESDNRLNVISGFDHYRDVIGVEHVEVAEKYHGGIKDKGRCDAGWRNAIHSSPDETGSTQRLSSSPLKMHVFIAIRCKESK